MTLLVDPPSPRDRGGQRQSTQRSATDQLDGAQVGRVRSTTPRPRRRRPRARQPRPRQPRVDSAAVDRAELPPRAGHRGSAGHRARAQAGRAADPRRSRRGRDGRHHPGALAQPARPSAARRDPVRPRPRRRRVRRPVRHRARGERGHPAGALAAHVGGQGPGGAAPARSDRRPHHVRLDRAVLPRARDDALGQQPGLVAEPAAGLRGRRRRGRRAGEHHPGRVLRRRQLRRLRADRRARLQPVHVPALAASRRGRANNPYTMLVSPYWQKTPRTTGRWRPGPSSWRRRSAGPGRG